MSYFFLVKKAIFSIDILADVTCIELAGMIIVSKNRYLKTLAIGCEECCLYLHKAMVMELGSYLKSHPSIEPSLCL